MMIDMPMILFAPGVHAVLGVLIVCAIIFGPPSLKERYVNWKAEHKTEPNN